MQFEPGKSGNPGGRPKRGKIITDALVVKLRQAEGSKLLALCDKLIELALDGEVSAIKEIFDRVEGKAPQPIVGDEENPVIIEHARAREFITRRILEAAAQSAGGENSLRTDGSAVH